MRLAVVAFRFLVVVACDDFLVITRLTAALFCVCNNLLLPMIIFHTLGIEASTATKLKHACMRRFASEQENVHLCSRNLYRTCTHLNSPN